MLMASRARERALRKRRTAERVAAGLCTRCGGSPALSFNRLCRACRQRQLDRYANRTASRCAYCNADNGGNGGLCADCCIGLKAKRAARKAAGLCRACDNPIAAPYTHCDDCRQHHRRREARRINVRKAEAHGVIYQPGKAAWLDD